MNSLKNGIRNIILCKWADSYRVLIVNVYFFTEIIINVTVKAFIGYCRQERRIFFFGTKSCKHEFCQSASS